MWPRTEFGWSKPMVKQKSVLNLWCFPSIGRYGSLLVYNNNTNKDLPRLRIKEVNKATYSNVSYSELNRIAKPKLIIPSIRVSDPRCPHELRGSNTRVLVGGALSPRTGQLIFEHAVFYCSSEYCKSSYFSTEQHYL